MPQPRNRPGIGPRPGFGFPFAGNGTVPGAVQQGLRETRLAIDPQSLTRLPQTGGKRYREDDGSCPSAATRLQSGISTAGELRSLVRIFFTEFFRRPPKVYVM
jgi:hypothetical protein